MNPWHLEYALYFHFLLLQLYGILEHGILVYQHQVLIPLSDLYSEYLSLCMHSIRVYISLSQKQKKSLSLFLYHLLLVLFWLFERCIYFISIL